LKKKGNTEHLNWSIFKVAAWLREIGLQDYIPIFKHKHVTGRDLDSINTQYACTVLKMKDKDCAKLLNALGNLKGDPAPDIRLPYLDGTGRPMTAKEAFRELSHKFHGKKPGKRKLEKRLKKREEELIRKKRNDVDTPLGTLTKLKETTEMIGKPFVVIDGKDNSKMQLNYD